ncbi:hypothetical protein BGZ83_001422 [Gryganskiella cystojenkinii]|nr:hypothetical protein BGZ83_001422 [Gryganskiella cystojenkinii]
MPPKRRQQEPHAARLSPQARNQQHTATTTSTTHQPPQPPKHPLTTPKILSRIADYLDKPSLLHCLHVNHAFYAAALPKVWHTVKLFIAFSIVSIQPHVFLKHSRLIHKIIFSVEDAVEFPTGVSIFCPNLTSLDITRSSTCQPDDEDFEGEEDVFERVQDSMVELIQSHSTILKSLIFNGYTPPELLEAISQCTRLEHLEILAPLIDRHAVVIESQAGQTQDAWVSRFEPFWSRLPSLTLARLWFEEREDSIKPEGFDALQSKLMNLGPTGLQKLDIETAEVPDEDYPDLPLFLIRKSPQLKKIQWADKSKREAPMAALARLVQAEHCPQGIESIGFPNRKFEERDFRTLLQVILVLKALDLSGTNFSSAHWTVLKQEWPHHLGTITEINIEGCAKVAGAVVQDMLCLLPNLEVFKATYVKDCNLEEDTRPWVCLKMRELTMAFVGSRGGTEPLFLSRLSALVRLETLILPMTFLSHDAESHPFMRRMQLGYYNDEDVDADVALRYVLQLTIEQGLEQLRTLRRLRSLEGTVNPRSMWRREDASWAVRSWPSLEKLSGMRLDAVAKAILKSRSVDISQCEVMEVNIEGAPLFRTW